MSKITSDDTKYRLKITAGNDYDPDTHQSVPVNTDQTLRIENDHAIVSVCVRIQNYTGYPDNSPNTNPYFDHPLHVQDRYSIAFSIIFKHPVNGNDLLFGNDFDRPLRHRLPPGFNAALRLVKWTIDPAIDGDAYADKPYLYSPALETWNQFRVGERIKKADQVPTVHDMVVEEGGEGEGADVRKKAGIPESVAARRKHFLSEEKRKEFEFEAGRLYWADFGNPYLDFNDFSVRLPGFTVHAIKYVDVKVHHDLRYVLKDRNTNQVYLVVLFTLVLLGTEDEPGHKERIAHSTEEVKQRNRDNGGSLGKFEWEPEPSPEDVE